jgi:hypothetical protein
MQVFISSSYSLKYSISKATKFMLKVIIGAATKGVQKAVASTRLFGSTYWPDPGSARLALASAIGIQLQHTNQLLYDQLESTNNCCNNIVANVPSL